jgi:alkylated DNA nucleotide flippase Atl1
VRANLTIAGASDSTLRSGTLLRLGGSAEVRVTHQCEICHVLRRYVPAELFPSLPGRRGWLGVVIRGGRVAVGDPVGAEPGRYGAVPDQIYQRLAWVLRRIPLGRLVTYDVLLALVGASRPYYRVLPTYLRRAHAAGLPIHRVLTSAGRCTDVVPGQMQVLAAEGIDDLSGHRWDARRLYLDTQQPPSSSQPPGPRT